MKRCVRRARKRPAYPRCRRGTPSTSTSATTTTNASSTRSSQKPSDRHPPSEPAMTDTTVPATAAGPKPKKSVALSGVPAGNTALCTVGRTGNDLHYRGYDILDIAENAEFEEIAYLLVHGKLPNIAELSAYKAKLRTLRGVPEPVREILERIPAAAHPMDVMRT